MTGQPKTLRSAIQEQIYLIGREALVNALRHSDATSIEAEIEYSRRRMRLVVRDDGCGIDQKVLTSGRNSHRGLRGMLERAEAVGARLEIWSKRGSGTEVELSLSFDPWSMPSSIVNGAHKPDRETRKSLRHNLVDKPATGF